jgi:hypothetical protein
VAGLVGVAGIAWAGTTSAPTPQRVASVPPPVASADADAAADTWLRLDSPARQDEIVTTRAIVVRGEAGPGVTEVWVGLESRNGKVLASRTIERGAGGATGSMRFDRQFRLASARATGRLFVTATAIGPDGVPTQSIRRRIETAAAAVPEPPVRHLVVRGWVARTIGDLHLTVTSSTREQLATSAIDPTGKPRNGMVPFEATFRMPGVSPETQLFVVPTDSSGRPRAPGPGLLVQGAVVMLVVR